MSKKVTITCLTYNHEKFIAQALESFVVQKTNFDFEVIIGDDASTDNTQKIIQEYADKYPNIIKPVLRTKNIGIEANNFDVLNRVQSKYVSLCEGDDYFTDPYKLQKQVDFLEAHPDCAICFHPVEVIWEDGSNPTEIFPTPKNRFYKTLLTLDDLLKHNFIQTNSCMYRWRFNEDEKISDVFPKDILPGDYFSHLLHAQKGKIGFIPDVMAVYRRHSGGIWTGVGQTDEWFIRCGIKHLNFYKAMEETFSVNRQSSIQNMTNGIINASIRLKRFDILEDLSQKYMSYYMNFQNTAFKQTKNKKYKKRFIFTLVLVFILITLLILK